MMIYRQNSRHRLKWILGFVIFVLMLSVTFDNAYGQDNTRTSTGNLSEGSPGSSPPSGVPEPTTLVLLASGLVALRLMQRKKH